MMTKLQIALIACASALMALGWSSCHLPLPAWPLRGPGKWGQENNKKPDISRARFVTDAKKLVVGQIIPCLNLVFPAPPP
jgi:hypothetical protein